MSKRKSINIVEKSSIISRLQNGEKNMDLVKEFGVRFFDLTLTLQQCLRFTILFSLGFTFNHFNDMEK